MKWLYVLFTTDTLSLVNSNCATASSSCSWSNV